MGASTALSWVKLVGLLSLPTKAFTLVSRPIHKHFRGDDITEREEHLHQLSIPKLLGQMVDEQVTALGPCGEGRGQGRRDGGVGEERDRGEVSELGSGSGEGWGEVRKGGLIQDPRRRGAAEPTV